MIGSLTCGEYEIYVAKSGGTELVCRLRGAASIEYGRNLNDFSEARVQVAMNAECVDCLRTVNPWEHEVLVFRGGQQVWCGPIITLNYKTADARVEIYARDLLAWTEKRFVELAGEDYEVFDTDIKDVFEWLLNHAYNKGSWNMTWTLSDTGIPIDRFYPGYFGTDRWGGLYPIVAEELRALSQSGIDYTAVNRHLYAGDIEVTPPSEQDITLSDTNWVKTPNIVVNGTSMSTRTAVAGGSGGYFGWYDDEMWIEETPNSPYGVLETINVSDESDAYTDVLPNPITQESYARHQLLSTPLAYIEGGQLAGNSELDFNDLIPGIKIDIGLVSSLRDIEVDYRLSSVSVKVGEESEEIGMTLSLPGVIDVRTV